MDRHWSRNPREPSALGIFLPPIVYMVQGEPCFVVAHQLLTNFLGNLT